MRRFLLIISSFALPLMVAGIAVEVALRHLPNDYAYKSRWLADHAESVEVLVLGSSHGLSSIRPDLMTLRTFNAAHVSQTLAFDRHILEQVIQCDDSLRWVVLPMSYFSLVEEMKDNIEWWREKNYCIYYGYPSHPLNPLYHSEVIGAPKIKDDIINLVRYWTEGTTLRDTDSLGYRHRNPATSDYDWDSDGHARAMLHTRQVGTSTIQRNRSHVEHIADLCRQHGVQMLLVTTPAHRAYTSCLDNSQLNEVTQFCLSLAETNSHIRYLNLLNDPRFNNADFHDADHLDDEGATKLTAIIDSLTVAL